MPRFKPVRHDQQLTLVEHLDELRHRLIVSAVVFGIAFALCFWQNHLLLQVANAPLPQGRLPITFGIAEPFTTTITVCAGGALVLALPILLYQLYAFALPALSHRERRAILPLLLLIPTLFIAGVAFAYFVVTPAATKFLLHFNDAHFNVQVRARDYYGFLTTTLLAVGIIFQVPVAILALARLNLVTPGQLARNRRYAYLVSAIVAAALPGVDPVTMLIELVPLLLLYELSIVLARLFAARPREPSVQPR